MFAGKLDDERKTNVELVGTKINSDQSGWRSSLAIRMDVQSVGFGQMTRSRSGWRKAVFLPLGLMVSPWRFRMRQDEGQYGEGALSAVGMDGEFREAQWRT